MKQLVPRVSYYCEDDDEFPKVPSAGDIQRACKKASHVLGTATRGSKRVARQPACCDIDKHLLKYQPFHNQIAINLLSPNSWISSHNQDGLLFVLDRRSIPT